MADLNKIKRSKERLTEVLNHLLCRPANDERTTRFINELKNAIQIIDRKIEDFNSNKLIGN
jgi:hypothetical protein